MSDREWPGWRPDLELSSGHLLGLEDYLIARVGLTDENAHGVELFNWEAGLKVEAGRIGVHALMGVTLAGEPVFVRSGRFLWADYDGFGPIDIWVEVNPLHGAAQDADVQGGAVEGDPAHVGSLAPPKMRLIVERAQDDAERGRNCLYLGQYDWPANAELVADPSPKAAGTSILQLQQVPPLRRLDALQPFDSAWKTWIAPFRERLATLGKQVIDAGGRDTAIGVELLRLQFEWPVLLIPALARRLRYINWLAATPSGFPTTDIDKAAGRSQPVPTMGRELPSYLAGLLPAFVSLAPTLKTSPEKSRAFEPPRPTESSVSDAGVALAHALAMQDVEYHAPLELIEQWKQQVLNLQKGRLDEASARMLVESLIANAPVVRERDSWAGTVTLITAAAIDACAGRTVSTGLLGQLSGAPSAEAAAREALEVLYTGKADRCRAGPVAFYHLAVAAVAAGLCPSPGSGAAAYFSRLQKGRLGPGERPGHGNRAYIAMVRMLQAPDDGGPGAAIKGERWAVAQTLNRTDRALPLRISMLGPPRSGKTSILDVLCGSGAEARSMGLDLTRDPNDACHARGRLQQGSGPAREIEVFEGLAPAPDGNAETLTVLTIDPQSLASADSAQWVADLSETLRSLIEHRSGRIALAYTKADEYGVVSPAHVRLVDASQASLIRELNRGTAWDDFCRGRGNNSSITGSAVITRPGAEGPGEVIPTRTWVLKRTRPLWEIITSHRDGEWLLNAYFVSAYPFDKRFNRASARGVLQVLADFSITIP